jgi:release factor glutamine methyltransferase
VTTVLHPPATIKTALADATRRLADAGIAEPRLDARILLGAATGLSLEELLRHRDRSLAADSAMRLEQFLARRLAREPVALILGRREFWSLGFAVTRDTLIPRPDSETLIESALTIIADRQAALRILDLGTGTGCLLLAMLSELPRATGVGVDVGLGALRVARQNAAAFGLDNRAAFLAADWGAALAEGTFDLVLANPPYVRAGEIVNLAREIAEYEPIAALSGGPDGLACYRALAPATARLLRPDGHALFEVGEGQIDAVLPLMRAAGLVEAGRRRDLAGIPRCLIMRSAAAGARAREG